MFDKVKKSLVLQTGFLFFISFLVIILLWIFFYIQQKYQHIEFDMARFFNTASTIQPYLYKNQDIRQKDLDIFRMKIYKEKLDTSYEVLLEKGDEKKGFQVLSLGSRQFLKVYNKNSTLILEDVSTHKSLIIIHLVFMLLLITQGILYIKLQKSLSPISSLHKQLKRLENGDLSPLNIDSSYEEIKQMISSYNTSVLKIEYILELREMFNKVFMHEMKMPLAKGMFYLKQEPSSLTHEKLSSILHGINKELDEFSKIESLIAGENKISNEKHEIEDLINIAKQRVISDIVNIDIIAYKNSYLKGDKEFWILCIKNLIDNALKYSYDKTLTIDCSDGIAFINSGDELPVDISKDIKKWKIDKNKRHKSSTGYGFGLFIIKNIIEIHGYKMDYIYDRMTSSVIIKII